MIATIRHPDATKEEIVHVIRLDIQSHRKLSFGDVFLPNLLSERFQCQYSNSEASRATEQYSLYRRPPQTGCRPLAIGMCTKLEYTEI